MTCCYPKQRLTLLLLLKTKNGPSGVAQDNDGSPASAALDLACPVCAAQDEEGSPPLPPAAQDEDGPPSASTQDEDGSPHPSFAQNEDGPPLPPPAAAQDDAGLLVAILMLPKTDMTLLLLLPKM